MIRNIIVSLIVNWIVRTFHLPMQLGSAALRPSYEYPEPANRTDISVGNGGPSI